MKKLYYFIVLCFFLQAYKANSQDIRFSNVISPSETTWGAISNIAQDRLGYIWFSTYLKGLRRYDGSKVKSYENIPGNPNSLSSNSIIDFRIDSSNIFWIATNGSGVDRFDPDANSFTHFRHDPKNAGSLCNDTILSVLVDRTGEIWIGTVNGLDKFNKKTGKFTHFRYAPNDPDGLQGSCVNTIYQEKSGSIWVSTVTPSKNPATIYSSEGALSKLDITTGKFIHYLHDPANPKSIDNNFSSTIYEDSKGNFWLGGLYGVQLMDRNKGTFTPWYFNRGSKLYFGPDIPHKKTFADRVFSIQEDITGAIWIIGTDMGVVRHEPVKSETRQYGFYFDSNRNIITADTSSGFTGYYPAKSVISSDGMVWVSTFSGTIYNTNLLKTSLPYYPIRQIESNSFYCEPNGKILWVATDSGLLRRDLINGSEKVFQHDPKNDNSVSNNVIYTMRADDAGKFWLGTVGGGLDEFDPSKGNFVHHRNDSTNPASIGNNEINGLVIDHNKNIWGATNGGIFKMEKATGIFTNYKNNPADSNSIGSNTVFCVNEDKEYSIWAGSQNGLYKLNSTTGKFQHFQGKESVTTICVDAKGVLWIGESGGVYFLDSKSNQFIRFAVKNSIINITQVLGITEDNNKNLWVAGGTAIYKINAARTDIKRYGEQQNVRFNLMGWNDNFKANDGRLFLGHFKGYYAFYPDKIKDYSIPPHLNIVGFKLGDQEITAAEKGSVLTDPIWKTKEIHLTYSQNVFSFDFLAINYTSSGDQTYFFKLEHYDNTWHDIGSDHRAFFFNVPPGNYIFHVKATDAAGNATEKTIAIIISAPWWRTWWAYTIYALLFVLFGWLIYGIQKRRIALAMREKTRAKELAQAQEIRKAYNELRTTQAQLIQSEKMASLGELTAGIAHEIQNPLNFVNNFSEVNKELLAEMNDEMQKGNYDEVKAIAKDITDNEEKINHHGKRADAIVKGMLQHSRSSSGQKEPTDINALCDEYFRLAYHHLRIQKDKNL